MKLYPKSLKYYFLTCDTNGPRKRHMMEEFRDYDISEINPELGIGKNKSGATGFSRMLDLGLRNQMRDKPFQPFVIFEDDIVKYREFPEYLDIPDDADVLYIGISRCGATKETTWSYTVYTTPVNNEVVRIWNMLSAHGLVICSAAGALAIQKAMMEGFFTDTIWDVFTARIQPYYNVYALKIPLVYQSSELGGAERETKFELTGYMFQDFPESERIPLVSIRTCFKKSII